MSSFVDNPTDRSITVTGLRALNANNAQVDEALAQVRPTGGGGLSMWRVGGDSLDADPESIEYLIATTVSRFEAAEGFVIPPHSMADVALVAHLEDREQRARIDAIIVDYEDRGRKHSRLGMTSFAVDPISDCSYDYAESG
ncbi:MAG: hypothetical protein Q4G34_03700 [Micrococcus sp.]|nr:hypothetical protein [Micrococcus sp.]